MSRRPSPSLCLPSALILLLGLAGCHLTGRNAGDLGDGPGRVDRTYPNGLGHSVRATLEALDDMEVRPKSASVRESRATSNLDKPGWVGQSNVEYLPDDDEFRDLFDRQLLRVAGSEPVFFAPLQLSYQGETADGRDVAVVIRSVPPDASKTQVMTRVGRSGDEAFSKKLLEAVDAHIGRFPKATPPAETKGKAADLPPLPDTP